MNQFSTKHESASLHQTIPPQLCSKKHAWPPHVFWCNKTVHSLKLTVRPWIYAFQKGKDCLPTIHFQVYNILYSFREGVTWATWPYNLRNWGVHTAKTRSHAAKTRGNASSPVATCSFGVFAPLAQENPRCSIFRQCFIYVKDEKWPHEEEEMAR